MREWRALIWGDNKAALLQGAAELCARLDNGSFSCLSCGKAYSDQGNCKRHIRMDHLGESKKVFCPNCNKQENKINIKRHMKKYCPNCHLFDESAYNQY